MTANFYSGGFYFEKSYEETHVMIQIQEVKGILCGDMTHIGLAEDHEI